MDSFINIADYVMSGLYMRYYWFFPIVMVALGGVFGSFFTCALYRVPRKLSLISPQSFCPSCNNKLRAIDLIPIFSFLMFGAKCRKCRASIPYKYITTELISVAIGLVSYIVWGAQFKLFVGFALLLTMQFIISLLFMEKMLAKKVLLFSIILLLYMFSY